MGYAHDWRMAVVKIVFSYLITAALATAIFDPHEERHEFLRSRETLDDSCKPVRLEFEGKAYYAHCFQADGTYVYQGDFEDIDKNQAREPQKGFGMTALDALARLVDFVKSKQGKPVN